MPQSTCLALLSFVLLTSASNCSLLASGQSFLTALAFKRLAASLRWQIWFKLAVLASGSLHRASSPAPSCVSGFKLATASLLL